MIKETYGSKAWTPAKRLRKLRIASLLSVALLLLLLLLLVLSSLLLPAHEETKELLSIMWHPLDHWKSKRVPEKHRFLLYWLCQSLWLLDHNKLWKILQEMGIPDHLTCLLRNLYTGQEATIRTGHGTTDWFQIGKGVCQGCILSLCLFNLYADYFTWNAGLDEAQVGIKIAERNINNFRYADDTTLMAKSEEVLKSLLMKVKENE